MNEEREQAEPVAWMAFGGSIVHAVTRNAMDPIEAERFDVPLYLHPPAAEVQQADTCPTCGSDCNERDELEKAEREIERLRRAPARPEDMAAFAAELKADPVKALAFFQSAGILNERGELTPEYAAPQQAEPCDVCNALTVPRNATHYDADDLKAAQVRGKIIAAKLQQQAEPVAQIGWSDEFGNLFPMGAWKPAQRTHHDSHKTAWRAVYLHPPAAEVQRLRDALKPFAAIDLTTNQAVDAMDVLRARRALEGGE